LNNLDRKSFELSLRKEIPVNTFYGQNYPTDFRKSPELAEFVVLLDKAKAEFNNYYNDKRNIVDLTATFELMDNVDKVFKKLHLILRSEGYQ